MKAKPVKSKWILPQYFHDKFADIHEDYFKFVFTQSEVMLKDIQFTADNTTKKGQAFLAIAVTVFSGALTGVSTSKNVQVEVSLLPSIVLSLLAIVFFARLVFAYKAFAIGSPPKLLCKENSASIDKDHQYKNLLLSECVDYQKRIDTYEILNIKRGQTFNPGLYLLLSCPIVSALTFAGTRFFIPNDHLTCWI